MTLEYDYLAFLILSMLFAMIVAKLSLIISDHPSRPHLLEKFPCMTYDIGDLWLLVTQERRVL